MLASCVRHLLSHPAASAWHVALSGMRVTWQAAVGDAGVSRVGHVGTRGGSGESVVVGGGSAG